MRDPAVAEDPVMQTGAGAGRDQRIPLGNAWTDGLDPVLGTQPVDPATAFSGVYERIGQRSSMGAGPRPSSCSRVQG